MSLTDRGRQFRAGSRDYLRIQDLLNVFAAVLAGLLAIFAYSTSPQISLVLGLLYLGTLTWIAINTIRQRRAKDQIQAEILWGLFSLINKEIFGGDHRTRFTLFREDSFASSITPRYRYFKGGKGPIEEAARSRARYKRNEGLTGKAWAEAGRSLLCLLIDDFQGNRERLQDYYVNELKN